MNGMYTLTVEDALTIISFVKMHERDEIPDDMWELCMKLYEALE